MGTLVSHCVQWLFGVAVEFLSCGSGLRAPPVVHSLLLGCDGGSAGGSVLTLGVPHEF